jgi:steroid delta-isomerase-like uncharacterized protein
MAEQENLALARETVRAWNDHDIEGHLKLIDDNYVIESDTLPTRLVGRDGVRQLMEMYIGAFPDLRFEADQIIATKDHIVLRWTASGTQRGDLPLIPATGRRSTSRGCYVHEVVNGKLRATWSYWDSGNLMRQLGVLPV